MNVIKSNPRFDVLSPYSRQRPALCVFYPPGTDGGSQVDEAAPGVADRGTVVRPSWFHDSLGAQVSVE